MNFKYLLFFLYASLVSAETMQPSPADCGEYKVNGMVRLIDERIKVVVHEKTRSEIILDFELPDQPRLTPFFDRPIALNVVLNTKWNGTRGKVSSISGDPEARVPDPLNPQDTGFKLVKTLPCMK